MGTYYDYPHHKRCILAEDIKTLLDVRGLRTTLERTDALAVKNDELMSAIDNLKQALDHFYNTLHIVAEEENHERFYD